jgi:hypothetical protein
LRAHVDVTSSPRITPQIHIGVSDDARNIPAYKTKRLTVRQGKARSGGTDVSRLTQLLLAPSTDASGNDNEGICR